MNLIEELAKQEMIKNHYIEHWTAGEKTGYWDGIADKELFRSKVKDFIPIFAEWIKGIENPFRYDGDRDSGIISMASETMRGTILSELDKMKNPVNIGGK